MAAPLAGDHRGMQGRKVPSPRHFGEEIPHPRGNAARPRKVLELVRIVRQIVELIRIGGGVHELVATALDHHERCDRAFGEVFAEHLVRGRRACELRGRDCCRPAVSA